jgi:cell division protein FtsB
MNMILAQIVEGIQAGESWLKYFNPGHITLLLILIALIVLVVLLKDIAKDVIEKILAFQIAQQERKFEEANKTNEALEKFADSLKLAIENNASMSKTIEVQAKLLEKKYKDCGLHQDLIEDVKNSCKSLSEEDSQKLSEAISSNQFDS